ncbi:MAG: ribulose-phosphate 3-epimerase [Patescibacteria group bacterium]|jgi:ribulose-phosphate 3-epimerase
MKNPKLKISPSILAADFGCLNDEIKSVEDYADFLHVDVMDGHFVPNITFGYTILNCIKSKLPLDCHLMIENPAKHIHHFIESGAARIATHVELGEEMTKLSLDITKKSGKPAGVAISPKTPVEELFPYFGLADYFVIMTVTPGFGGQKFMAKELSKVTYLRKKFPDIEIKIDGGMDNITAPLAVKAGGDNIVAGSYIFKSKNRVKAIKSLRMLGN